MSVAAVPAPVQAAGVRTIRDLDVRPLLARGEEPFAAIMSATDALRENEALHLIVSFEPRPLYDVMRKRGYAAHTEREGGDVHVWFYRESA
ncbi:MAG: hypothetical protein B6D46_12280 [Polyangiaceae bacterium UTPRO1]|jgi:uncharacterized protein (DUF2249 family)|nr:DUF2249 domain-containing protein [Myxococcales bacterium]OQY66002.1 MAG: hypothetical protein B6D46_12280 [Polyangiaceae bacterium UTPRO1]